MRQGQEGQRAGNTQPHCERRAHSLGWSRWSNWGRGLSRLRRLIPYVFPLLIVRRCQLTRTGACRNAGVRGSRYGRRRAPGRREMRATAPARVPDHRLRASGDTAPEIAERETLSRRLRCARNRGLVRPRRQLGAAGIATAAHRPLKVEGALQVDRRLRTRTKLLRVCVDLETALESSNYRVHEIVLRAAGETGGSPSASRLSAGRQRHAGGLPGRRQSEVCRENIGWSSSEEYRISGAGTRGTILAENAAETQKLISEIQGLKNDAAGHVKALKAAAAGSAEQRREIEHLKASLESLVEKHHLEFIRSRVHPSAHDQLHRSQEFREAFSTTRECSAFVLSIDIRRSTELMLKARTPEKYADFIATLSREMTEIVINALGVFDKFTGDGILAFFPDFYSGPDAAYRAVAVADSCHAAFDRIYRESRTSFKTVLTEIGLGIGIDFGQVRLVQLGGGLTVVGEPVVYACRLSGGPPKTTLVNQPAYEQINAKFGALCFTEERNHEIKHEGSMLAYEMRLNGGAHVPALPKWAASSPPEEDRAAPSTSEK